MGKIKQNNTTIHFEANFLSGLFETKVEIYMKLMQNSKILGYLQHHTRVLTHN